MYRSEDVKIADVGSMRLAAIRHVGPHTDIGPAFERLADLAAENNLFRPGTRIIGIHYDDPGNVPADQLRADAAITVSEDFESGSSSGTHIVVLQNGRYAVMRVKGPYNDLHKAYEWLYTEWMQASGAPLRIDLVSRNISTTRRTPRPRTG